MLGKKCVWGRGEGGHGGRGDAMHIISLALRTPRSSNIKPAGAHHASFKGPNKIKARLT